MLHNYRWTFDDITLSEARQTQMEMFHDSTLSTVVTLIEMGSRRMVVGASGTVEVVG